MPLNLDEWKLMMDKELGPAFEKGLSKIKTVLED
jgi:hypothetical protein